MMMLMMYDAFDNDDVICDTILMTCLCACVYMRCDDYMACTSSSLDL